MRTMRIKQAKPTDPTKLPSHRIKPFCPLHFIPWLKEQKFRDDPVGDLAQDLIADRRFTGKYFSEFRKYLHEVNACDGALAALRKARAEWLHLKHRYESAYPRVDSRHGGRRT